MREASVAFPMPAMWFSGWMTISVSSAMDGWFTPGHTPGHQSLRVRLSASGDFLLSGDCCYTEEILDEDVLPGLVWNPSESVRAIRRLRAARDWQGIRVITGHDPETWAAFRKAPDCYR